MPTLLLRISIMLHLIHTILNYLPDKLRSLLKSFWFSSKHDDECKTTVQKSLKAVDQYELSRVFEMFDHDGDGRISRKELHESLDNLGIFVSEEDLSVMIEKIDVNEDGCVDMEEFGELYKSIVGGGGGREEVEEDVKEAFDVFDVNGDGYISVEELRSVLASLGLRQGWTKEDVRGMIGKVDEDGDGRVSFEEFKVMMRSGGFVGSL